MFFRFILTLCLLQNIILLATDRTQVALAGSELLQSRQEPKRKIHCPPSSDELMNDEHFKEDLDAAWTSSRPDLFPARHEEGGWVYWKPTSDKIHTLYQLPGSREFINLWDPPVHVENDKQWAVVAVFHTHPNPPKDETGREWEQGPTANDIVNAKRRRVPSFIRNRSGTVPYGAVKRRGGYATRSRSGVYNFNGPYGFPMRPCRNLLCRHSLAARRNL